MRLPQDRILHIDTEFNDGKVNLVCEWQGELVRCKGCKHYIVEGITTQYGWCHEYKHSVNEDDYCSYGERKKPTIPMFKESAEAYKAWTGEDIGCKSFTADEWYRNNFKDGDIK